MSDVSKLSEIIESFRKTYHYECEDCFYSCPKNPDYCGTDDRNFCNCGTDETNRKVDEAIALLVMIVG